MVIFIETGQVYPAPEAIGDLTSAEELLQNEIAPRGSVLWFDPYDPRERHAACLVALRLS